MKTTYNKFIKENDFYKIKTLNCEPFTAYDLTMDEDGWIEAHEINRTIVQGEYEPPVYYIPRSAVEYIRRLPENEKYDVIGRYFETDREQMQRLSNMEVD